MSEVKDSDEIPEEIKPEEAQSPKQEKNNQEIQPSQKEIDTKKFEDLQELLSKEKQKVADYEKKLKRSLADFQNLQKKTESEIEKGVNTKIDKFLVDFLEIYDDFIRAKESFADSKINTDGLDSILKNIKSLMSKYQVTSIDALGEIFDPNLHDAISVIEEPTLDESTITKEIRKGYISGKRVIRPTLVEISKKPKSEKSSE